MGFSLGSSNWVVANVLNYLQLGIAVAFLSNPHAVVAG